MTFQNVRTIRARDNGARIAPRRLRSCSSRHVCPPTGGAMLCWS
ncbi:hypothetical protein AKJ09_01892 [Labilithrix luteola]|uniref:Uncharacterized protein n=1 Tax=Labilithrix luteola TaxID=1391654 RepID=A0A0K1PNY6_9BACT|nr:hypothetical protein AKJ09_01892 [Labilithrix luteola]